MNMGSANSTNKSSKNSTALPKYVHADNYMFPARASNNPLFQVLIIEEA
jgi:hypothetical protein